MKLSDKSPIECSWDWVEGHVLFWCSFEVHGSLVMLLFWGHVLRMVAELMVLLYTHVGQHAMIQVTRTQPHPSKLRAMAKRSAEETLDRDRSPRGRSQGPSRGQSLPAGSNESSSRPQPVPVPNFKLEIRLQSSPKVYR